MLIDDRYKIESDSLNVTLYRKREAKEGNEPRWQAIAYFSTVKNALDYLVDLEVNETGLADLKTVVEKVEELKTLIKGLGLPPEPTPERARGGLKASKDKSRQLLLGKAFTT